MIEDPHFPSGVGVVSGGLDLCDFMQIERLRDARELLSLGRYVDVVRLFTSAPKKKGTNSHPFIRENVVDHPGGKALCGTGYRGSDIPQLLVFEVCH